MAVNGCGLCDHCYVLLDWSSWLPILPCVEYRIWGGVLIARSLDWTGLMAGELFTEVVT